MPLFKERRAQNPPQRSPTDAGSGAHSDAPVRSDATTCVAKNAATRLLVSARTDAATHLLASAKHGTADNLNVRITGVTLIELMVALAILVIVVAVAVPSFQNARESNRVQAAAEAVFAHFQFARSEAIRQSQDLTVQVTPGTAWCLGISNNTAGCDCNTAGSCLFGLGNPPPLEQTVRSTDYFQITLATTANQIVFDSRRGTINALLDTGQEGSVTVTGANNRNAQIRFSSRGRVRLCGNVGGYPPC